MKFFLITFIFASLSYAGNQKQNPCEVAKIKMQQFELIEANIANVDTTRTAEGGPYRRQLLKCKNNVCAVATENKTTKVFMPEHADADVNGYVAFPKINLDKEMSDLMAVSKDYQAAKAFCE